MRVDVVATPNATRTKVGGVHEGALKVRVHAVPEKGRANHAIALALAKALRVRKSQVQLVAGATSRRKTFEICEDPAVLKPVVNRLLSE